MKYLKTYVAFVSLLVIGVAAFVVVNPIDGEVRQVQIERKHVIYGKVVGITDGDTITVLDKDNVQYKIRLAEIDTPEKKQAYGTKAKQILSDKIFGKEIEIEWDTQDRYKRIIGFVFLDSRNINHEMVREGYAWHYKQYSKSKELDGIQLHAQSQRLGLWQDKNPIPPWEFRSKK